MSDLLSRRNSEALKLTLQQMEIKLAQLGVDLQKLLESQSNYITRLQLVEAQLNMMRAHSMGTGPTER